MSTSRGPDLTMGPQLTPVVKVLIISCAGMFLLSTLGGAQSEIFRFLGLVPYAVVSKFFLWQPVTYLFLHANLGHVFWNMFALWMFGCELERTWGSREFLRFFLITGVGAGLLSIILNPFSPIPTVGASGAIYGILAAFGLLFPERVVLLFFVFPVKAKKREVGPIGTVSNGQYGLARRRASRSVRGHLWHNRLFLLKLIRRSTPSKMRNLSH